MAQFFQYRLPGRQFAPNQGVHEERIEGRVHAELRPDFHDVGMTG